MAHTPYEGDYERRSQVADTKKTRKTTKAAREAKAEKAAAPKKESGGISTSKAIALAVENERLKEKSRRDAQAARVAKQEEARYAEDQAAKKRSRAAKQRKRQKEEEAKKRSKDQSPKVLEHKAEVAMEGASQYSGDLRKIAARKALKFGVLSGLGVGFADSTETMAKLEAKTVKMLGVGYKAVAGGAILAIGAIADYLGSTKKGTEGKRANQVAAISTSAANTLLTFEAYNLGVTRFHRVKNVIDGLPGDSGGPSSVAGIAGQGTRRVNRVGALGGRIARRLAPIVKKVVLRRISDDEALDDDLLKDLFHLDDNEILDLFEADDDDDDVGEPDDVAGIPDSPEAGEGDFDPD